MKNLFLLLSISSMLFLLPSCKKEKTTSRDYTQLNKVAEPLTFPKVDSATAAQLYAIVNDERTIFLARLEQDYPGLKTDMDAAGKIIVETTDSSTREGLLIQFNQLYYQKVSTTWANVGFTDAALSSQYASVLGTTPFTLGEFGTISIGQTDLLSGQVDIPTYPDDTVLSATGTPLNWKVDGCGLLGFGGTESLPDYSYAHGAAVIAGGCISYACGGNEMNLPERIYNYFNATLDISNVDIYGNAWAIGGGAGASATITAYVERDGMLVNSRDVAYEWVAAPIIWYSEVKAQMPGITHVHVATRNNDGLTEGAYKAYIKNNVTISAIGIGATIIRSDFHKHGISLRATR